MGDDPLGVACSSLKQARNAEKNYGQENTAVGQLQPGQGGEGCRYFPHRHISLPTAGASSIIIGPMDDKNETDPAADIR